MSATVLDALGQGFEVHIVPNAARAVERAPGDGEQAIVDMREAGAVWGTGDR